MQLLAAIQTAISNPTSANVRSLLQAFDVEIAQQPEDSQFKAAGDLIVQFAHLIELRATLFLRDWEERYEPETFEEPLLPPELLQDLLRQTMTLNLEDILEVPERKERDVSDSIVAAVEKDNMIQFLDQLEHENAKQAAMAIAYEEDISEWVRRIRQQMCDRSVIPILELHQSLSMPFSQVWLALLLGDFRLEQTGAFYDPKTIVVRST